MMTDKFINTHNTTIKIATNLRTDLVLLLIIEILFDQKIKLKYTHNHS